eukprot:g446.t1
MCLSAFSCGGNAHDDRDITYLRIMPSMQCFGSRHMPYMAVGLAALMGLYPYATLSYPLFQVVSMSRIKFDHDFVFFVIQIQTVLMLVSTLLPTRTYLVLGLSLAVDTWLVLIFAGVPNCLHCVFPRRFHRPPCTVPSINHRASCAFAFSAWLNVCSALTVVMGSDIVAVVLLITFSGVLTEYAVVRATRSVLPDRLTIVRLGEQSCKLHRSANEADKSFAVVVFDVVQIIVSFSYAGADIEACLRFVVLVGIYYAMRGEQANFKQLTTDLGDILSDATYVASARATSADVEWVQHVLIDISPNTPTDAARELAWKLPTDTVEWYQGMQANRDDYMRSRGVATSAAEQYEFEESLQFETNEIFQHFWADGVATNETGQPPSGGFGDKPTMTDIAPLWAEQVRQGLLRPAPFGDCVTQDNVGAPMYSRANGGFDARTNALFAAGPGRSLGLPPGFNMGEYVQQQRRRIGLGNNSCPVPFTPCAIGVELVQDRVVREIIRFHFVAHLRAWKATRDALKQDAAAAGRPEPAVYGNVHIIENVYSVLASQYLDVVWTETPAYLPRVGRPTWGGPASGFSALLYKLGRAAGNFTKPHWGIVTLTGCGLAPAGSAPQTMTAALAAAEAVANGGMAALDFGDAYGGGAPDPCLPSTRAWTEFVDTNRHLFARNRYKLADVAILYSVPSRMWLQDTSLAVPTPWASGNTSGLPLSDAFAGMARVAEDHHLLYDVLILDHPSVSSFGHLRTRLPTFRVAVLPVVQALSDADAVVLAAWVRAGGVLVAVDWAQTAMYDEDFVPRASTGVPPGACRCTALQSLRSDAGQGEVRVLKQEVWNFAYQGFHDVADDASIAAALTPPPQRQQEQRQEQGQEQEQDNEYPPIISVTGLPPTVWANVWVHGAGPLRSVALVNYDGNATANTLVPVHAPFTLRLRCDDNDPAMLPAARARARTQPGHNDPVPLGCKDIANATITSAAGPGSATRHGEGAGAHGSSNTSTMPLALSRSSVGGVIVLSVTVPAGTIRSELSVIAFSAVGEWNLRAAASVARKWTERLRIAQRSWRLGTAADVRRRYVPMINAAVAAIDAIEKGPLTAGLTAQGEARMTALASALRAELANVTRCVMGASIAARADAVAAARGAVRAISAAGGGAWQPLRYDTVVNSSTGYGWVDAGVGSGDRRLVVSPEASLALSGDHLHGAYIGGTEPSTLQLDLPAAIVDGGTGAVVTLVTGSYDTARMVVSTAVQVSGATTISIPADVDISGRFRHIVFRVSPAECRGRLPLFIRFSSPARGHFYGDGYGQGLHTSAWLLNGVIVMANSTAPAPTAAGRRFESLAKGLAATALARWWFVGPFYDPHFTAGARTLEPESGDRVDLNMSYVDGFGGNTSWRALSVERGDIVPSAIGMPPDAAARSANTTVVVFLCARVFVPPAPGGLGGGTLQAQLVGSSSSLAALRVNGAKLAPDRLITGRSLREFSRAVLLLRGECNEVLVKVQQPSWATVWEMSLSLGAAVAENSSQSDTPPAPIAGLREC